MLTNHKLAIIVVIAFVSSLLLSRPIFAQDDKWFYPVDGYQQRHGEKPFGKYIDASFYTGKEQKFPSRFYGFHSGEDLETFANENDLDVPVYAISDGIISFVGHVNGYGGVILEKLADNEHLALYGHVNWASATVKTGQQVSGGTKIGVLGKGFSSETDGERKHLHFGIYKGTTNYFAGHEPTQASLNSHWLDPTNFLESHEAKLPGSPDTSVKPTSTPPPPSPTPDPAQNPSLWDTIKTFFQQLLSNLFH